jgi:hypothetical protein
MPQQKRIKQVVLITIQYGFSNTAPYQGWEREAN